MHLIEILGHFLGFLTGLEILGITKSLTSAGWTSTTLVSREVTILTLLERGNLDRTHVALTKTGDPSINISCLLSRGGDHYTKMNPFVLVIN